MTRSFGRPGPADDGKAEREEQQPVPVLHVGEVHAELRLTVSDDTLRDLGSQIASMLATAAKQGFEHGLRAAMEAVEAEDEGGEMTVPQRRAQVDLDAAGLHLSEADIERVRRAV